MKLTELPIRMILHEEIHPDPNQPRRSFDLTQMEQLQASIAEKGILQPLLVRWDAVLKRLMIVCGERRWLASKELKQEKVPCRVIDWEISPKELLALQLTENLQREDMNPIDEARGLQRLQELLGCSREALAMKAHRSPSSICRAFKLLELPVEVQSLVEVGQLPESIAAELHRCTDPLVQLNLAEKVVAKEMTREDVVLSIRQAQSPNAPSKSKSFTVTMASGLSLRIPRTIPLKDCQAALAELVQEIRNAKKVASDVETFVRLRQPATVEASC